MRVSIPDHRELNNPPSASANAGSAAELAQLAIDLRVDVEGLLAAREPALVAGNHDLAHLLPQRRVLAVGAGARSGSRGRRARQGGELGLDVERRLAAPLAARRLGLEQLADLRLGLGARGGAPGRRICLRPVEGELAAPDRLVRPVAADEE